jgi:predicted DNA-binding ribbon-helix-helix protein
VKRSVSIAGRKTSVNLEEAFCGIMKEISEQRSVTLNHLVSVIDSERQKNSNPSSAIRVFVLNYFRLFPRAESAYSEPCLRRM